MGRGISAEGGSEDGKIDGRNVRSMRAGHVLRSRGSKGRLTRTLAWSALFLSSKRARKDAGLDVHAKRLGRREMKHAARGVYAAPDTYMAFLRGARGLHVIIGGSISRVLARGTLFAFAHLGSCDEDPSYVTDGIY